MSAGFKPVSWTASKIAYDAIMLAAVAIYLLTYLQLAPMLQPEGVGVDDQIRRMRAFGSLAFVMITFILCIGPLARLDRRWLPLLYNRRHFGVFTAVIALMHAGHVLGWYFAFGAVDQNVALFSSNTSFAQLRGFPFELFGLFALIVLCVLAATSHDFWLRFLGPQVWKSLHMLIYAAYAAIIAHIALGALISGRNYGLAIVAALSVACVIGLHLAAAWRPDERLGATAGSGFIDAGAPHDIPEGRARIVQLADGRAVAIFRYKNALSAVDNACAHQNGPLGEGCIVDGLITCPWHGFQYRLNDGRAPAPFDEKLATYNLHLKDGHVRLDPRANAPGTPVEPLTFPAQESA